jgi:predicted enzyme related to lactoylglutathione lyase
MRVERIDRVVVAVKEFDNACRFFEHFFGIEFDKPLIGREGKAAYSAAGLEIFEPGADGAAHAEIASSGGFSEGIYSIVVKVPDIKEAIAELNHERLHSILRLKFGKVKEAVLDPRDCHGARIVLCEYPSIHPCTVAAHDLMSRL